MATIRTKTESTVVNGLCSMMIYESIPGISSKRIMLLGENHESNADTRLQTRLTSLAKSLYQRGECLDLYIEARHEFDGKMKVNKLNTRTTFDIDDKLLMNMTAKGTYKSIVGGAQLKYLDKWMKEMPGLRIHRSDGRGVEKEDRYLRTLPGYCQNVEDIGFNVHELIALYYGIGPESHDGEPNKTLASKAKIYLQKAEDNPYIRIKSISYDNLSVLRSKLNKTLLEWKKSNIKSFNVLYLAMAACIIHASRGGATESLRAHVVEAFADIYTFLRMFRTFDMGKERAIYHCKTGDQKNIVYVSHVGHSISVALLIYMVYNVLPEIHYDDTGDTGAFRKYVRGFIKIVGDNFGMVPLNRLHNVLKYQYKNMLKQHNTLNIPHKLFNMFLK